MAITLYFIESAIPPNEERLGASVRRGQLSAKSATAAVQWADKQVKTYVGGLIFLY